MQKYLYILSFIFLFVGTITAQEVRMVTDLTEGSGSTLGNSLLSLNRIVAVVDDIALFSFFNSDEGEWQMWRSDGTAAGTYSALSSGGVTLRDYEITEDAIYVSGHSSGVSRVYKAGTEPEDAAVLAEFEEEIYHLTYFENALYFGLGFDDSSDAKLMKYDLATDELSEMMSLFDGGVIDIGIFQNQLMFVIKQDNGSASIYLSDGTIAGTSSYYDFAENYHNDYSKAYLTADENKAFFFYRATNGAYRLFVTDGTNEGTANVANYQYHTWNPSEDQEVHRALTIFEGKFFFKGFVSGEVNQDAKLYITDGTPGEVILIEDIAPGEGYNPRYFTEYNDKLFFAANTNSHKAEIYSTDGTAEGTIVEINGDELGSGNSFGGSYMQVFNDSLFFQAYRGETGTELWKSNGTTTGTDVIDVIPFSDDCDPHYITAGDNLLFFAANDNVNGIELWVYDPNGILAEPIAPPVAGFSSSAQELEVSFTNGTTGEASDSAWTFGDGNSSTEENPVYTYDAEGTYNVCLTATGVGGSDTVCEDVMIMTSGVYTINSKDHSLHIYPNPANKKITLTTKGDFLPDRVRLFDILGRSYTAEMNERNNEIEVLLPEILAGKYIIQLLDKNGQSKFGTVVILELY